MHRPFHNSFGSTFAWNQTNTEAIAWPSAPFLAEDRNSALPNGPRDYQLQSHTDLGGQITSTTYNLAGQQSSLTSTKNGAAARNLRYEYDGRGQLRKIIDNGAGTVTEYSYDAAGHRTRETFTAAVAGAQNAINSTAIRDTRIQFDELGRVQRVSDTGQSTVYTYDASLTKRATGVTA